MGLRKSGAVFGSSGQKSARVSTKVNDLIKLGCASYEKLFYIGSASFPFPGSDRNGKSQAYIASAQSFQSDGVHLSIYGQCKLFRSVLNVFKK